MQNEFEKQVQQKMEELNFVPSEPVWEKIEEQIRKKKDRRKAFLWLPFLLLLLAGGSWWLSSTDETSIASGGMALAKKQKTRIENTAASLPNTNKSTAVNTNAA